MCNACILQSLHLSIAPSHCPSFCQLVCYLSRGSCFTVIITLFSSMLTLSVCSSPVVLPNSQSFPSNESISIINRSVIESVSLWDRPLVSWLNKKNSSRTRERQSVIITFMLLRLLVKHHLCVTCVLCCFAGHCLSSISPRRPGQITAWETSCRCCRQLSFEDRLSGNCWG